MHLVSTQANMLHYKTVVNEVKIISLTISSIHVYMCGDILIYEISCINIEMINIAISNIARR